MAPEAPSPVVDLRPLTTSELIDRGFSLYRKNFAGLLLLALLGQATPLIVEVAANTLHLMPSANDMLVPSARSLENSFALTALGFLALLVSFFFGVVMTFYVADVYLGKVPSLADCFRRFTRCVAGSTWTFALKYLFYGLTLVFPMIALVAVTVWYSVWPPASFGAFVLLGFAVLLLVVASLVPILIVVMRLMLAVPVLAMEGLSGWAACRRSSALVRYDPGLGFFYWGETRLSLLLLPLFVIHALISSLTSVPMIIAQINEVVRHGSTTQLTNPSDAVVVGSQVLTYLAGALILPLYTIAITIFYYDVRIRREGFDLEFLAQRLEAAR